MGLKENIKAKRLEHKLTLEEIAVQLGVSRQTVQKYESGVVGNIPSDKIEKLAKILKTTPARLMGWEEKPPVAAEDDRLKKILANPAIQELLHRMDHMSKEQIQALVQTARAFSHPQNPASGQEEEK